MPVDPYEVLGVPYGSSLGQVRSAWRAAARRWHPDANPENPAEAEEAFAAAKNAYEALSKLLEEAAPEPETVHVEDTPAADEEQPTGTLHDPFALYPGKSRTGENVRAVANVSIEEAISGTRSTVQLTYHVPCVACAGTGAPGCLCGGSGIVTLNAYTQVNVPAGSADGSVLRMPRRGGPGWGGATPGDLEITVKVQPDGVWTARGRDLEANLRITTANALHGAHLSLAHPRGALEVHVPPGSLTGFTQVFEGAGITGSATVHVKVTPLNLADSGVIHALTALDRAERSSTGH